MELFIIRSLSRSQSFHSMVVAPSLQLIRMILFSLLERSIELTIDRLSDKEIVLKNKIEPVNMVAS